jgi:hypothetical protein
MARRIAPDGSAEAEIMSLKANTSMYLEHLGAHEQDDDVSWRERVIGHYDEDAERWEIMERDNIIHPGSLFMHWWSLFLAFFILVCVLFTPFQIGFSYLATFSGTNPQFFWACFNPIMDLFFVADMVVNFRSAYYDDGELVQDWKRISSSYFKTWFTIDFLATFTSIIIGIVEQNDHSGLQHVRILRMLRLFKLFNVLKLRKVNWEFFHSEKGRDETHWTKTVAKLLIIFAKLAGVCHVMGCIFYFISADNKAAGNPNWVDIYFPCVDPEDTAEVCGHNMGVIARYQASLYWAFVTATTVGELQRNVKTTAQ